MLREAVECKAGGELSGTMNIATSIVAALEAGSQGDVTNLELARPSPADPKGNFSGTRHSLMLQRAVSPVLYPELFEVVPERFPSFVRRVLRGDTVPPL